MIIYNPDRINSLRPGARDRGRDDRDTVAPPQAGVFTLVESLADYGPEPVRIEALSILSPQQAVGIEGGSILTTATGQRG
jgi:hypothetical protein